MNKILRNTAAGALFGLLAAGAANAGVYTEDFEQPFPAWESGWFGTLSDASNIYCTPTTPCAERGNNEDGLWLEGQAGITVNFGAGFGASLTSFTLDVAGYTPTTLSAYDMAGALIFSQNVFLTYGAYVDPGRYANYTITSTNGISRFAFSGMAAGNVSVDNLVAITNEVPEPATLGLLGLALLGVAAARGRSRKRAH
jgi:hypothetical protein